MPEKEEEAAEMKLIVPLNTPICLRSYTGKIMQNAVSRLPFGLDEAFCRNQNLLEMEQMLIIPTADGKFVIQSKLNGKNLQVKPSKHLWLLRALLLSYSPANVST
jgi:hypothetical protein